MDRPRRPTFRRATCAALLAASFAVGSVEAEAESLSSIERYCKTSWRQAGIPQDQWEDCTQEAMAELLSRVSRSNLGHAIKHATSAERRQLMRSVWCVAQRWRRASSRQPVPLEAIAEYATTSNNSEESVIQAELIQNGLQRLSETQRRVLALWTDGHSIAEISATLQIPAARVSDHKYKGIRTLRAALAR